MKVEKAYHMKKAQDIPNCLVLECPKCGRWLASVSADCPECMPLYMTCNCDHTKEVKH